MILRYSVREEEVRWVDGAELRQKTTRNPHTDAARLLHTLGHSWKPTYITAEDKLGRTTDVQIEH